MPHPRPAGDEGALSVRLRAATSEIHKEAEQRPFMKTFFAGTLPRDAYLEWLARQWHLYQALETALGALPDGAVGSGVVPRSLHRAERIADDLVHWCGRAWEPSDHRSAATARYVARIESAASFPPALVAHAWLRYLGNVGGRDVLRRLAASSLGIDERADHGLSFTDFSAVGEIRPFFAAFHARLDAMELDDEQRDLVVAEGIAGFQLNIALTDELADDLAITV